MLRPVLHIYLFGGLCLCCGVNHDPVGEEHEHQRIPPPARGPPKKGPKREIREERMRPWRIESLRVRNSRSTGPPMSSRGTGTGTSAFRSCWSTLRREAVRSCTSTLRGSRRGAGRPGYVHGRRVHSQGVGRSDHRRTRRHAPQVRQLGKWTATAGRHPCRRTHGNRVARGLMTNIA